MGTLEPNNAQQRSFAMHGIRNHSVRHDEFARSGRLAQYAPYPFRVASTIFSSAESEKPSLYALGMTTVPPELFTLS